MHDDQLLIDVDTVTGLVAEQFPAWRDRSVVAVTSDATVNAIFRIGDDYAARFPLRSADLAGAEAALAAEALALRELADVCPFPTPRPVAVGRPGRGYPGPWSVQTWLPGAVATAGAVAHSTSFALDLSTLIEALRAAPTRGRTFNGSNRGGDLRRHDHWVATCLANSVGLLDTDRLGVVWSRLRELPRSAPDLMCHGDLTPPNLLVAGEHLAGVLDGGGFGPADPALDLVAAWHLLDDGARDQLRRALRCDDLEWARGAAWAFEQALGLVWYYRETNPGMSALGRSTLSRILRRWPRL